MGFKLFIGLLLLFILLHMGMYFLKKVRIFGKEFVYKDSLQGFRKILYAIFIIAILTGILLGELQVKNWTFMLILAGIIVFVDMAIILTPSILKLGSAEFKYGEEIQSIIKTNDRIQEGTQNRVGTMSAMIQDFGSYIDTNLTGLSDSKENLNRLLSVYGNAYGLKSEIWELNLDQEMSAASDTLENIFRTVIVKTIAKIELMYGFQLTENREENINDLIDSMVVMQENVKFMIVPVYVMNKDMLVVVESTKGDMLEVDAMHITNLIVLYYAFFPHP